MGSFTIMSEAPPKVTLNAPTTPLAVRAGAVAIPSSWVSAVITTAAIPGRRAPRIVSRAAVERMKAGAVIIGRTNTPSALWHGYVDEVAYYNGRVLSATGVADRYVVGHGG